MAKRKRRPKAKGIPLRVKLFAGLLVFVTVTGIAAVKFLQTPRGHAVLLEAGVTDYHAQVQEELEGGLRAALEPFGLQERLKVRVDTEKIRGGTFYVRHWDAACAGECSLVKVGVALANAVKGSGASTTSKVETLPGGGEVLVVRVGTRRYPTHRIRVRQQPPAVPPLAGTPPGPRLALVIDDFGYARTDLIEAFLSLDLPLTISVIPELRRTRYVVQRARAKGKEAILHLPMEAEDHEPTPGFVLTSMADEEIESLVEKYVSENPEISGVNNHMGSKATRDSRVMEAVISVVKTHRLFFLDSLTSSKSVAYNTAKTMDVPTAKNDLFLDADTEDPLVVEERLLSLLDLAKRRGRAIGIGHPKAWTYEAIKRNEDVLRDSGVELVFVSQLME